MIITIIFILGIDLFFHFWWTDIANYKIINPLAKCGGKKRKIINPLAKCREKKRKIINPHVKKAAIFFIPREI